jgi:hypothetical protein
MRHTPAADERRIDSFNFDPRAMIPLFEDEDGDERSYYLR